MEQILRLYLCWDVDCPYSFINDFKLVVLLGDIVVFYSLGPLVSKLHNLTTIFWKLAIILPSAFAKIAKIIYNIKLKNSYNIEHHLSSSLNIFLLLLLSVRHDSLGQLRI